MSFAPNLGFISTRDTSVFSEYMAIENVRSQFPGNVRFAFGIPETNEQGIKSDIVAVYALKTVEGSDKAKLEGDGVQQASQDFDDRGRPAIKMLMTKQGERIWGEMTTNNVGKPIAIVLDNLVYSAPNVINPITTGHTLVVPIEEIDEWTNLSEATSTHLMLVAKRIGLAQKALYKCNRVGLIIAGFEIPHCHLHVIPANTMADLSFEHAAPHVDNAQLAVQAQQLGLALRTI